MLDSLALVAAIAAAGAMVVAKPVPEREAVTTIAKTVPAGDKVFAPICKTKSTVKRAPIV